MIRTPLTSERITMTDPRTGIRVTQLTSYPTPSMHFMYDWPSISPDNRRVMLMCQRSASRGAPWDLFRCDTDGLNLFQLTEQPEEAGLPIATLTLDGETLYAAWRPEHVLRSIDVESGRMEDLLSLEQYGRASYLLQGIRIAPDGRHLYVSFVSYEIGSGFGLRVDLSSGAVTECACDGSIYGVDQTTGRLIVVRNFMKLGTKLGADGSRVYTNASDEPITLWTVEEDGSDPQYVVRLDMFAHSTLLGKRSAIQGPSQPPHRCIWIAEPGKEPWKLVEGPYFWHAGPSFDGDWILSDTNWPDAGLQYVHVPSRHYRTLCHAHASQGHTQTGHCHPALSQDGRIGVFTSDRTGVTQVYVAHITDAFRESVVAGELDNPRDKWI